MFKFQRKHSVGGNAKKRYLHFERSKNLIGDNFCARVRDNELAGSPRQPTSTAGEYFDHIVKHSVA